MTTLLRLSLNVAAARVILLDGYQGTEAAGRVIESFGAFVVGGNYAVGIAVFAILVIINFVVITKGAGRIAEVAARFVLDGMPGKQMAIDADLNAGLINQEQATVRRQEVGRESRFLRGDGRRQQVRARRCGRRRADPVHQPGRRADHRRLAARSDAWARRARPIPC